MNILVTVGTTSFDELISLIDQEIAVDPNLSIVAQTSSSSTYKPINIESFRFRSDFSLFVDKADLIITHAGAGSVYSMLEKNKRLVVVPNLIRADNHQLELAQYVQDKNFAVSCFNLSDLEICISRAAEAKFSKYECENFFGYDLVRELLK